MNEDLILIEKILRYKGEIPKGGLRVLSALLKHPKGLSAKEMSEYYANGNHSIAVADLRLIRERIKKVTGVEQLRPIINKDDKTYQLTQETVNFIKSDFAFYDALMYIPHLRFHTRFHWVWKVRENWKATGYLADSFIQDPE